MSSLLVRSTLGLLVVAFAADARAATIEFLADATVSSSQLALGDVAHVRAEDAESVARLEQAILGPAPGPGRRMVLDVASVRSRLRALNFDVATMEFAGRSRVLVTGELAQPEQIAPEAPRARIPHWQIRRAEQILERELERHLQHRAPELGLVHVEVRVPPADAPAIIEARVGGYQFSGGGANWNEAQTLGIRYFDRRQQVRGSSIEVRVESVPYVFVAAHDLPRGHVVRAADLVRQQVANHDDGIGDPRLLVGRETTRTVREGSVVSPDHVRVVPLVRSNDVVTITSRAGGVAVQSYGRARRDGGLDDVIAVRTIDGRETLTAKVVGYHEVEVVTPGATPTRSVPHTTAAIPGFRFEQPAAAPRRLPSSPAARPITSQPSGVVPVSYERPADSRRGVVRSSPITPRVSANPRPVRSQPLPRTR